MKSKPDPESLALTSLVFIAVLLLSLALVVVTVLAESLPAGSVALAVAVMVPSPNPEAPMALTAVWHEPTTEPPARPAVARRRLAQVKVMVLADTVPPSAALPVSAHT